MSGGWLPPRSPSAFVRGRAAANAKESFEQFVERIIAPGQRRLTSYDCPCGVTFSGPDGDRVDRAFGDHVLLEHRRRIPPRCADYWVGDEPRIQEGL